MITVPSARWPQRGRVAGACVPSAELARRGGPDVSFGSVLVRSRPRPLKTNPEGRLGSALPWGRPTRLMVDQRFPTVFTSCQWYEATGLGERCPCFEACASMARS